DTVRPTSTCVLLHMFSPTTLTLDLTELTPTFLAGTLLILVGSFLRVHCFHALGPSFTLQLSIHPTPVTDGMYGIIRHPNQIFLLPARSTGASHVHVGRTTSGTCGIVGMHVGDGCIPIVSHAERADEEGGHDAGEELW
ncbi:hypothetical protein V8E55_009747, partial [Tylopilus felleus]